MNPNYSDREFEERYTYSGKDLGACWTPECTAFRLWAPTARRVSVKLYESGNPGAEDLIHQLPMTPAEQGTWVLEVPGDLNGIYYTFCLTVNRRTVETIDPYARAAGVNGQRGMVIDLHATDPAGWQNDTDPHPEKAITDCVICELHTRDLSMDPDSGIRHKGKFLGIAETGTGTPSGIPTGLDHIKSLGVTHIHLMPAYDFGSVDEAHPEWNQFNWGYDPVNFNIPEGSYSTDPWHGEVRIAEFKQMVQQLHENGVGIILDVVYNHVFHAKEFSFNRVVPGYFSRENSNGSGCGNDTASERTMVRKYIVDSVNYWADEYHIDGFRFDLVGLIDVETIRQVMETVRQKHPHCLFYGEGWSMATNVTKENVPLATQYNSGRLPGFAFFNDTLRDCLRGSVFNAQDLGFAAGNGISKPALEKCFLGAPDWAGSPAVSVNYVSCHDNHTLADRIAAAMPGISRQELVRRNNLAAAFSILSQGIPFFQIGEEMLRSKKDAKGKLLSNTYNAPDSINAVKWAALEDPLCRETVEYYKGLLAFRKAYPALRQRTAFDVSSSVFPIPTGSDLLIAFHIYGQDYRIIAAFNAEDRPVKIMLPKGSWEICIQDNRAGTNRLGIASENIVIPPLSALVLVQKKEKR